MFKKKKWTAAIGLAILPLIIYCFVLAFPGFLFAHQYQYRNFHVYSDDLIEPEIEAVLDEVSSLITASELYVDGFTFNLYLCNDNWRFALLSRNKNAGGVVNFMISPNIILRESNIPENAIVPPASWRYSVADRPLSYFIAHEAIHSLQRAHDPLMILTSSPAVMEGYADYMAYGDHRSISEMKERFREGAPRFDPHNGLYDRVHLYVGIMMEDSCYSFQDLLRSSHSPNEILEQLR